MSDSDFQELLNMDAENAVRPPAMPSGTYKCRVKQQQGVKSRDKGTPGIQFDFTDWEPQADVDVDRWQEFCSSPVINPTTLTKSETFWLTPPAMWRLKEFCVACGTAKNGPMGKLVADAVGQSVLVSVTQTVGQDGQSVYNNLGGYAMVA